MSHTELVIDGDAAPVLRELTPEEAAAMLPPLAEAKASRLADLAAVRWARTQSFAYDGVVDAPADSAMTAVTGVVVADQIAPIGGLMTWKLKDGEFRTWSVEDVAAYGMAIRAHVQACFDHEQALSGAIAAAADHAALEAIDLSAGWPA